MLLPMKSGILMLKKPGVSNPIMQPVSAKEKAVASRAWIENYTTINDVRVTASGDIRVTSGADTRVTT